MHSAIIFSKSDPSSFFIWSLNFTSSLHKLIGDNKQRIVTTTTKLLNIFFKLSPPIKGQLIILLETLYNSM